MNDRLFTIRRVPGLCGSFKVGPPDISEQQSRNSKAQRPENGRRRPFGLHPVPKFSVADRHKRCSISDAISRVPFAGRSRSRTQLDMTVIDTSAVEGQVYKQFLPLYPGGVSDTPSKTRRRLAYPGGVSDTPVKTRRRLAYPGYPSNFGLHASARARARARSRRRMGVIYLDILDMNHNNIDKLLWGWSG